MARLWTNDQELLFIELYPILPATDLSRLFPFTKSQMKCKAARLKITKKGKLLMWKYAEEVEFIELYPEETNAVLAKRFGKTQFAIGSAAFVLKLRKTKEFMRIKSAVSQFKKGSVPINKGKKISEFMSPEAIERSKVHRYKKGNLPHNTINEVGKIRVRNDNRGFPYQFICLELSKWIPYHKYVWEATNGPQPKNHVITFKDGNTLNADISNLVLITRAENMRRNNDPDNPTDGRIAFYMATKKRSTNMFLQKELLKHPELLALKREQLKLQRELQDEKI